MRHDHHTDGITGNNEIKLRMKAITKLPIFFPDFLLHALQMNVLLLQLVEIHLGRVGECCKGVMQVAVLGVKVLEFLRLHPQLLSQDLVAHWWRCTAGAATARGADRSAPLGFQVSSRPSCLGHGQLIGLGLALQWVGGSGGSLRDTVGL